MANEWIGVVNATAPKYLQGAANNTIRNRLLLMLLQRYGRMEFNQNGYVLRWDVQYDEPPAQVYGDAGVFEFARHDVLKTLELSWGGYLANDLMTYKEKAMNDGNVAIVRRYDRMMPQLQDSLQNKFCAELYGTSSGDPNRIDGLETFFANHGTTVAADRVATPSGTYGGKSCTLGADTGTWTSNHTVKPNAALGKDWPSGSGDARYDWNSYKKINWSSTNWGTGSTAWIDNCERVLRQTFLWLTHTGGKEGRPTIALLSQDLFYDYQNKQEAKQRILVPHKEASDLGFPDTLNQEGVMVRHEYDVPANVGYVLNIYQMMLSSLYSQLFWNVGPYDVPSKLRYELLVGFFGNVRYNVKHQAKLQAVA